MTSTGILQILLFFALILVCVKPLGAYMANVFEGRRTLLHPVLRWLEVLTYRVAGVREDVEQRWTQYVASLLAFSIFGFLLVYLLQVALFRSWLGPLIIMCTVPLGLIGVAYLVAAANRAGVKILAGTDMPSPCEAPLASLHRELQLLRKAGLSPFAALRTATVEPARYLGRVDAGTLGIGKIADIVLVDRNPLRDIGALDSVSSVILHGAVAP